VGITGKIGMRVTINAAKLYVGVKLNDHERLVEEACAGLGLHVKL
jgi:hypothetical protein